MPNTHEDFKFSKDWEHEVVKSSLRYARLKNPVYRGNLILRHVRQHLISTEWERWSGPHISDAVMMVDLSISRVNFDLRV